MREQKRRGKLLGEALVELGFVNQETLSQFLAQKTQTESVDLARLFISPELSKLVSEALAKRLVAIPIARTAKRRARTDHPVAGQPRRGA